MIQTWEDLNFWSSGEWEAAQERLDEEESSGYVVCPSRVDLFAALEATPYTNVHVAILGQDPYPSGQQATGLAFSIPTRQKKLPPSLDNIFTEYCSDLSHPHPTSGNLSPWAARGVLLWNAIPSCREGKPASHHWPEWEALTQEIVEVLDERGHTVFCLLGRVARSYRKYIRKSCVIETSHPSPLGARQGFLGSKIFSKINDNLPIPINWRLP